MPLPWETDVAEYPGTQPRARGYSRRDRTYQDGTTERRTETPPRRYLLRASHLRARTAGARTLEELAGLGRRRTTVPNARPVKTTAPTPGSGLANSAGSAGEQQRITLTNSRVRAKGRFPAAAVLSCFEYFSLVHCGGKTYKAEASAAAVCTLKAFPPIHNLCFRKTRRPVQRQYSRCVGRSSEESTQFAKESGEKSGASGCSSTHHAKPSMTA